MRQLTILNRALVEEVLIFEFSDAPETVEIQEAIRSEIARMVTEINLGAQRTESVYLDIRVEVGF